MVTTKVCNVETSGLAMDVVKIEEAGVFHFEYSGPNLELLAVASLQLSLHTLFENIALKLLLDDRRSRQHLLSEFDPAFLRSIGSARQRLRDLPIVYGSIRQIRPLNEVEEFLTLEPMLFMRVESVRVGSWFQDLSLVVAPLLANSDVRAVLAGLGANVIYAISKTGIQGIFNNDEQSGDDAEPPSHDPFEIGDNLSEIIKTLINSGGVDAKSFSSGSP